MMLEPLLGYSSTQAFPLLTLKYITPYKVRKNPRKCFNKIQSPPKNHPKYHSSTLHSNLHCKGL